MFDFDQLNVAINGVFGESVSYQPAAGGAPFAVSGVVVDSFRTPFYKEDGTVGYTTTAPAIGVETEDGTFDVTFEGPEVVEQTVS
ncbi:head-tail joining protein [Burkholderia gladioli]|uniref:head-tail joining protein n=1 Tax=Burkholderia gladioli TaxID=28095 RepID=UPI00163FAB43|nr:hypothetical protein [Burkholderia gladioli]